MKEVTYLAALQPALEGGFTVTFPDAPGAISEGDDLDEAIANAREALELILEAHAEAGEALPARRPIDRGADEIRAGGAVAALISVAAPSKTTRINITIDEGLLERVNRVMQQTGRSRSAFFAEAARAALREKV